MKYNSYINNIHNYRKCTKIFDSINYIFLEEISHFKFKKISKYLKSKNIYDKIITDFNLVNKLLRDDDLLNAVAILRTLFENIVYLIATSYDKTIRVTLDSSALLFRKVLEDNCSDIFFEYFESADFNNIYKYLCKIIHPCSLKELMSYLSKTKKYRNYMINNIRYVMLVIQYMYLNYLTKRVSDVDNLNFRDLIDLATYVNLVNVSCYFNNVDKSQRYLNKYLIYDTNNKYVEETKLYAKELYDQIESNKELIETNVKDLINRVDTYINFSSYRDKVYEILNYRG